MVSYHKAVKTICIHSYCIYSIAVSGQECTDMLTIGSLSHDGHIVTAGQTFILDGYVVPCNKTVVAWEFCHRIGSGSVTFYPGIWKTTGASGNSDNRDYALIQSNSITYDANIQTSGNDQCQRVNLSVTDQFTAPAGSVVGLYSGSQTQLLYTNIDTSITTYQFNLNQSSVSAANNNDINYNIAVRVHLGKHSGS